MNAYEQTFRALWERTSYKDKASLVLQLVGDWIKCPASSSIDIPHDVMNVIELWKTDEVPWQLDWVNKLFTYKGYDRAIETKAKSQTRLVEDRPQEQAEGQGRRMRYRTTAPGLVRSKLAVDPEQWTDGPARRSVLPDATRIRRG